VLGHGVFRGVPPTERARLCVSRRRKTTPMKSMSSVTRWLHIVVATLAAWSSNYVEDLFKRLSLGEYYLVGVVLLAVLGMQASDWIALTAVERLRPLRLFLAGHDDVEGDWVAVVVNDAKPDEIVSIEYSRIRYRGGQYVLTGDAWTTAGRWVQNYETRASSFSGRELEFYYRTGLNRVGGFGIRMFSPNDSLPTAFVGRYVDEDSGATRITRGRRVARRFRVISQDKRREAATQFADDFAQQGLLAQEAFARRHLVP
jgi:hypothetical protein